MMTTILNSSRRHFIKRLGIASSVLAVSPIILLGQNNKQMLRFAVFGDNKILSKAIEKTEKITLVDTYKSADVIYIQDFNRINLQSSLMAGKHLMVERHENSNSMIEKCQKAGVLLAIVESSEDGVKLFKSVEYYESNLDQTFDFQKVMIKLDFLVNNTQKDKFKIFPYKF